MVPGPSVSKRTGRRRCDLFVPEQAVKLATAIGAYTTGGAFASFGEQHGGSLARQRLIALSPSRSRIAAST